MATTTITGSINGVNNTALANKWITFRLVQLGTDSVATATVAQSVDSVQTDANGDFSIDVWNNGDSGKTSILEITVEGSKAEKVIIPAGTASIELWDLIENYQADGSTSEQVPTVSALFLRKSNNLSDLASATTSRTNLGVAIGTDVQAHSATLDATTASFTTADETKLDGIEALADVTDATNIAASGGYVAGGTDVALADGGTGASDAPTARTNLGLAIGSDVQAHSAVLDATDASFTTAKDAAISANTANIASNDTDIGTLTGSVVQNQTDIATNLAAIALNTAKVTNATHTGDVTGDTALTIATDAVDIPMLSATGTPDATSFLRGDNTWAVPAGGDLLAANNLSELTATASTARANIGVSIGSDIQAHSAILDGTTASFTTAIAAEVTANTAKVTYPTADSTKLAGYSPIAIITDATTARTLALTDIGAYIRLTNASSCTITLPANATVAWASETEPPTIYFRVAATGIPTLSNAGVTINDTLGVVAALEAGSTFALQWVATDVWDII